MNKFYEKHFNLTREQKIRNLIHKKYSIDDELAILRQKETKPQEYKEYYDYCEKCKEEIKNGNNKENI